MKNIVNNKEKKAQITGFIIIAIILLILTVLTLFILNSYNVINIGDTIRLEIISIDRSSYQISVESCLNEIGTDGVFLLSERGGYIYDFDKVFYGYNLEIAYSIYNQKNIAPSKEFMENEISRFVEFTLPICINQFGNDPNYNFSFGEILANTIITKNNVRINVEYPITIISNTSKATISKFKKTLPLRLGYIIDVRDDMINNIQGNDKIDLDFFSSNDLIITILPYNSEAIFYTLTDIESKHNDIPLLFQFGVKDYYIENKAPVISDIENQFAYIDEPFYLKVEAFDPDSDSIAYFDETAFFDIGKASGEIMFTPSSADVGEFLIPIIVKDRIHESRKSMRLIIIQNEE
ncbi:MAG: hypothetical protein ABII01_07275 [Candidatus Woesearchaeota archaeon]